MSTALPWSRPIRLSEVQRGPVKLQIEPEEAVRKAIARELDLESLDALSAEIRAQPWLDGLEINGRFKATVTQLCSITAEPLQQQIGASFTVRAVPEGSNAAPAESAAEIDLDPEADDPPDVLETDEADLGAYLVEHLALEIDPFPRKPGAEFAAPAAEVELSPFAALKALKTDKPAG